MMKTIQLLRGTKDVLGEEGFLWESVEAEAREVFRRFGFKAIRTPVLEESLLFRRSVGEHSDIVEKEMIHFKDRSGVDLALRPEGTASVVRAFIQYALGKQQSVHRFYYMGPMFRGERPQKGRLRQFHQIGAEIIGSPSSYADLEILEVLALILDRCGASGYAVEVNNLGTDEDRKRFAALLKDALKPHRDKLCADCRRRLEANVLRVLDCKRPGCQPFLNGAPDISKTVSPESRKSFEKIQVLIKSLGIPYRVNPRIVRGLDYYTGLVFEVTHPGLGSQNVVAAGGRYDALVKKMGGQDTPAVGFALGLERLLLIRSKERFPSAPDAPWDAFFIALGQEELETAYRLSSQLRRSGFSVRMDFENRSLKSQMRQADKSGARFALILGEEERSAGLVLVKDLSKGDQWPCKMNGLASFLKGLVAKKEAHA